MTTNTTGAKKIIALYGKMNIDEDDIVADKYRVAATISVRDNAHFGDLCGYGYDHTEAIIDLANELVFLMEEMVFLIEDGQ
jgi:hypothetical protein